MVVGVVVGVGYRPYTVEPMLLGLLVDAGSIRCNGVMGSSDYKK